MVFHAEDFGGGGAEAWMGKIGEAGWRGEVSPALAWLMANGALEGSRASGNRWPLRKPAGAGLGRRPALATADWAARTPAASNVVLDMLPGADALAVKSYQGYWLRTAAGEESWSAEATLVIYNFGVSEARVRLRWPAGIQPAQTELSGAGEYAASLVAGERREIPVRLSVAAKVFAPSEVRLEAEVRQVGGKETETTYWAARFFPWPQGLEARAKRDFTAFSAQDAAVNREQLLNRAHAPEEPALVEHGRWLVTPGVRVEETPDGWRILIERLPGVGARPAVAELPLPLGWTMPEGTTLSYDYRLLAGDGASELRPETPEAGLRPLGGRWGDVAESYIRTENGNLFSTVPRLMPKDKWLRYNQNAENLTMHFLGRTSPPWRFLEQKPAALVFFIRPKVLPAVFEVRAPHQASWVKAGRE
jgi:hypothetical protein